MSEDRLLVAKNKFSRLLKEIFQFDCADLDFGIYRILAMRRTELERFLDDELLPQVESILEAAAGDRASVQGELSKLEASLRDAGIQDFSSSPKWNELRGKLSASPDLAALAREAFSDLTTFFARYYDEGDFMALPRYKGDTYAIPYDGSEVKLHWANADQYYIKTTEQHADYTAVIDGVSGLDKPRLRFRLAAAESDRDNNKATEKRRYVLRSESPVEVAASELTVWFEYRVPEPGNVRQPTQNALCGEAEKAVLASVPTTWQVALTRKASRNSERYTVLGYQLYRYTKRNTSDYFIHKDLGGFLRRELDFFIKNEVLFLDDIEGRTFAEIEVALQKVKAIRAVGGKIIDWLAQIEDFQRKLFLKRKFVLRTGYVGTATVLPEALKTWINACEHQRAAWEILRDTSRNDENAAVQTSLGDNSPESTRPMLFDTAFFDDGQTLSFLAHLEPPSLDSMNLAVAADNFHALRLLGASLQGSVDCIYIDPPYNTGNDDFLYKDGFGHSSWLSMIQSRLSAAIPILSDGGLLFVSIDDTEVHRLRLLCEHAVRGARFVAELVWKARQHLDSRSLTRVSYDHEYILAMGVSSRSTFRGAAKDLGKYGNPDGDSRGPWMSRSILGLAGAGARPNLHYDLVDLSSGLAYPCPAHTGWRYSKETMATKISEGRILFPAEPSGRPREKVFLNELRHEFTGFSTVLDGIYTAHGSAELRAMFGSTPVQFPKPTALVEKLLEQGLTENGTVVDFFAGSGTTGHAVLNLNRHDAGNRRFVLVEFGEHFDEVLVPRLKRAMIASRWGNGRPSDPSVYQTPLKYIYLESYDDALENIVLERPAAEGLFEVSGALREDYTLRYMLNLEAEGSLLNLERFRKPWDYTIKVRRDGVVQDSPIDLVETFNYLVGLRVKRYDTYGQEGLLFVVGTDPKGRRVVVVWRDCDLWPNDRLEEKCRQAFESFRPDEFDLVYVNGDNHLPIIKTGDESWRVNLIEETFHARMFDTSDVE